MRQLFRLITTISATCALAVSVAAAVAVAAEPTTGNILTGKLPTTNSTHLIGDGGEQRRGASEHGCGTCSIWTMNRNRLVMLPCWNTDANDPVLAGRIRVRIGLSNDDVLIVTGGDDGYSVREGAIATALSAL